VPRALKLTWIKGTNDLRADTSFTPELRKRFVALRRQIIKALQAGGVGIVLGSDSPQFWNAPGFSLNRELASYVAAGLTPYQALLTGTRNIARFLGNEAEAGTIAVGKRADLILLDANPLADIKNVARKAGVMIGGHWLAREEIQRQLATLVVP
jgi:imidazolonepropionase-like amidohydrolase